MGPRGTQGCQDPKVTLEQKDLLVSQALQAPQERRECLDTMVRQVPEGLLAYRAPEAPLGHLAFQDSPDLKGTQGLQGFLAQLVQQLRASMDPQGHQGLQVREATLESLAFQGPLVLQGPQDRPSPLKALPRRVKGRVFLGRPLSAPTKV